MIVIQSTACTDVLNIISDIISKNYIDFVFISENDLTNLIQLSTNYRFSSLSSVFDGVNPSNVIYLYSLRYNVTLEFCNSKNLKLSITI